MNGKARENLHWEIIITLGINWYIHVSLLGLNHVSKPGLGQYFFLCLGCFYGIEWVVKSTWPIWDKVMEQTNSDWCIFVCKEHVLHLSSCISVHCPSVSRGFFYSLDKTRKKAHRIRSQLIFRWNCWINIFERPARYLNSNSYLEYFYEKLEMFAWYFA